MSKSTRFDPVTGTSSGDHRYWEPNTIWGSANAEQLVDLANAEQAQNRIARTVEHGGKVRKVTGRRATVERATVAALVLDALAQHIARGDTALLINLDNNWLSGGPVTVLARNRTIHDRLYDLEETGWLRANRSSLINTKFRTTIAAGPRLLKEAKERSVGLKDIAVVPSADVFEVRPKAQTAVAETDVYLDEINNRTATETIRQMATLNDLISSVDLTSDGAPIDTRLRHLKRVFLDGSVHKGGRTGGNAFWLNLPKSTRRHDLRIAGEPLAEVDIRAAIPSIAYGLRGLVPEHDPYTVPGLEGAERDAIKVALMQFLWKPFDQRSSRLALAAREGIPSKFTARMVFEALCQHNAPIADLIGADPPWGATLQWHESELIVSAAIASFRAGVPNLPLHDALLVPKSGAKVATAVLFGEFHGRFGVPTTITVYHSSPSEDGWEPTAEKSTTSPK